MTQFYLAFKKRYSWSVRSARVALHKNAVLFAPQRACARQRVELPQRSAPLLWSNDRILTLMENVVFLAVLFAALCHAGWNALIKVGLDPLSTTTLISLGAGLVALAFVPFVGVPAAACWPWLIASVVIHLFYFASLIESYRTGDLGQVYPLARGSAPLMTATVTALAVGEHLSVVG